MQTAYYELTFLGSRLQMAETVGLSLHNHVRQHSKSVSLSLFLYPLNSFGSVSLKALTNPG